MWTEKHHNDQCYFMGEVILGDQGGDQSHNSSQQYVHYQNTIQHNYTAGTCLYIWYQLLQKGKWWQCVMIWCIHSQSAKTLFE